MQDDNGGWKAGPLPKDTWNWGGVVPTNEDLGSGFYFADFVGDHVKVFGFEDKILKAEDVKWYNNTLKLPPNK